jgi:hypothetical protein
MSITLSDVVKVGLVGWAIWEEYNKETPPVNLSTTGITTDLKTGVGFVPVVYGRNIVDGQLVYADTSKSFKMTAGSSNSQQEFHAGPSEISSSSVTIYKQDPIDATLPLIEQVLTIPAQSALKLDHTYPTVSSSDLLYAQYVISKGEINKVVECIVDSQYISSPALGASVSTKWDTTRSTQAALRIDTHNNGGIDTVMSQNKADRTSASFTGIAYASCVFKINAVTPQFSKVPDIKFMIEGKKIRTELNVGNTALLTTRIYSNNPAWVLLDYLLDVGTIDESLRITESMIDLVSFKNTAISCDEIIVETNNTKILYARSGKFYNPTSPSVIAPSKTAALKRYECNIVLDTSKPIVENIKAILLSMPEASLIWSGGKYKLLMDNPTGLTITDSDLVLSQEIERLYPPANQRFNYCTVTFKNESSEFAEEKVSWPPKITDSLPYRGVGPFTYNRASTTNWGDENNGANVGPTLLNNYAIWSGEGSGFIFTFKLYVTAANAGAYYFQAASGAANFNIIVTNLETNTQVLNANATNFLYNPSTATALTAGRYSIILNVTGAAKKGIAAKLTKQNSGIQLWNTTNQTFSDFISVPTNTGIYNTLLAADGDILANTEVATSGITDFYHAALLAKYTVEKSRNIFNITFSYIIRNNLLEPGDIVMLDSDTLDTNEPLRLRILQVDLDINNICKVTAVYAPIMNTDISEFLATTVSEPTKYLMPIAPGKPVFTPIGGI